MFSRKDINMRERLKLFFQNIFQNRILKYILLVLPLGLIWGLLYGVFSFTKPQHQIEIDMRSDHAGHAQLFWIVGKEKFSEQASVHLKLKEGDNHLKFVLPLEMNVKLKRLRFDPTDKNKGKFEITKIQYIRNGKNVYLLPVERIKKLSTGGLQFVSVSENKASMKALTADPVIVFTPDDFDEPVVSVVPERWEDHAALCIMAFILWIILLHCFQRYWNDFYPGLGRIVPVFAKTVYALLFAAFLGFIWFKTALLGKVTVVLLFLYGVRYLCFREWKKEKKPEVVKPHFDWGMHYFRAVAIACICFGHTLAGAGKENWCWMFFQADSIYFLFISGYLAQFLFSKKPDAPLVYYKKKVINIISPYIVFSTLILTFLYFTHSRTGLYNRPFTVKDITLAFCFGRAAVAYWYIPFVCILFLWTPLLVRLPSMVFMQVLFIFGSLAVIFPQRGGFANLQYFIYLYTYFTFSYLFGMAFSRYREPLENFFRKNFLFAFALAVGIAVLIGWNPAWNLKISVLGLLCSFQKILFCIFFIVILSFFKDRKIQILSSLAEFSFTIYFIHLIFYEDYQEFNTAVSSLIRLNAVIPLITGIIFLFHMLLLSVLLKKILGKHSRYFIGT